MTIRHAFLALRELWGYWLGAPSPGDGQAPDSGQSAAASRGSLRPPNGADPRQPARSSPLLEPASIVNFPITSPAPPAPGDEVPPVATGSGRRRLPARGPDGRFIRRRSPAQIPAAPAGVPPDRLPGVPPDRLPRVEAPAAPPAMEAPVVTSFGARGHAAVPSEDDDEQQRQTSPIAQDAGLITAATGRTDHDLSANRPIRLVLVEDVPEVAAHVRELLRPQGRFTLVQTIREGRRAVDEIRDLDPDVVLVDALLQGRVDARRIVDDLRSNGRPLGIVAMTVPDYPVEDRVLEQADAVLTLPFGTYDLGRGIMAAHAALTARDPGSTSRIVTVFSAKGGVGKTTIAFNLAASLAATGLRTVLLDGSLQFGDVRRLLGADATVPSICDLPTDGIRGSDLAETVVQVASGVDALLAPPRPELAELINGRDLGRVLDILRRAYQAIVVDTPSNLGEPTLALLDASDVIIDVLTAEPGALEATRVIAATFPEIGYPADKVRYLVNRADSVGAAPMTQVAGVIGRLPEYTLSSDWPLVSSSNREGVPYVLAQPEAPVSVGLRRVAHDVRALAVDPPLPVPARNRARIA